MAKATMYENLIRQGIRLFEKSANSKRCWCDGRRDHTQTCYAVQGWIAAAKSLVGTGSKDEEEQ